MSVGFTISSSSTDFQNKSKDVFDQIDNLKSNEILSNDEKRELVEDSDSDEGVCCSPPPSKLQKKKNRPVPNYLTNPDKWKRYDLEDIKLSSNSDNLNAAFAYLKQKDCSGNTDSDDINIKKIDNETEKLIFKVPRKIGTVRPIKTTVTDTVGDTSASSCDTLSCDKVELDHLEENISTTEFEQSIAAKLEEEIEKNFKSENVKLMRSLKLALKFAEKI